MNSARTLFRGVLFWIVLGICTAGVSVAMAAWSAPVGSPPTCTPGSPGCDAPVNITSTAQTKSGAFTSGTSVTAPQYCIGASCISSWASAGTGGTLTGGGSAPYIPMWSSGTGLTNSTLYDSGGVLVHTGPSNNWAFEVNWPPSSGYGILVGNASGGYYSQFENASGYWTDFTTDHRGVGTNGNINTSGRYYRNGVATYGFGGSWQPAGYPNPFSGTYGCPSGFAAYRAFSYSTSALNVCYI